MESIRKRSRNRLVKSSSIVSAIFSEYCSKSSIHGIGYLGAKDKGLPENARKLYDISLICDLELVRTSGLNNFTNENAINNIKKVAPKRTKVIKLVLWQNKASPSVAAAFSKQITSDGICFTFNSLNHKDIYTNQIKENVTFISENITHTTNWSIEDGYTNTNETENYPRRTTQDGSTSGLNVLLMSTDSNRDFACGEAISGYKLTLHNPAEAPRVNNKYFLVPLNKHVTVAVTPNVITTSKGLRNIAAHRRNCYFKEEKILRFFHFYTKNNCKTECFANITNSLCDCIPFYMPRDDNTKICGLGKMECLANVQDKIIMYEMMLHNNIIEDNEETLKNEYEIFKKCDCLPACASIDYSSDISDATFHWNSTLTVKEALNKKKETKKKWRKFFEWTKSVSNINDELKDNHQTSRLNIFFKESEFVALHRKELFGRTDFLANCGGLLGLFMGFSFLSLLEIIYFVTIRTWIYFRRRNQPDIDVKT